MLHVCGVALDHPVVALALPAAPVPVVPVQAEQLLVPTRVPSALTLLRKGLAPDGLPNSSLLRFASSVPLVSPAQLSATLTRLMRR